MEVRVTDPETGRVLGQEEIGGIEVKGPNVFSGYWRMPEKTAAEFRPDGFFITGDVGKIDSSGYVHIVGRAKDLVICGGYNVYPKEVETVIDAIEGVAESAVVGVPHPDFGEAVVAIVLRRPGSTDVAESRSDRGLQGAACQLQGAEAGLLHGRAAAQRHGQGAEEPAARPAQGPVRHDAADPDMTEW